MIKNYFITALRSFSRNPMYSLINLIGLAVGLTASILIMLYVFNELNFDTFHEKSDQIYRMNVLHQHKDGESLFAVGTAAMGVSLEEEFPEIVDMVRFTMGSDAGIRYEDKNYEIDQVQYADSNVFRMFSFDLIRGNPETALKEPFSIVLTPNEAHKIFKDEDPMGKFIRYNNQYTMKVTGILEKVPPNSHLQFDALISFSTLYEYENIYLDWDGGHGYYTYVEFIPGFDPSLLEKPLETFMQKHINYKYNQAGANLVMMFEPLENVHLFSRAMAALDTTGNMTNIYIFSAIALFVLLIACINFMNLSTARSSKRAREVGVRKVIGATEGKLRRQFLAESTLLSLFAMILALILVELVQPVFNELIGRELSLYDPSNSMLLAGIFVLIILVGFVSGSYPAFYLSSFKPVRVLKGGFVSSKGKTMFRDILVVFQFTITIGLIVCTIVIFRQIHYMKTRELGFIKENIVYLELQSKDAREKADLLKNELRNMAFVKSAGASSAVPGRGLMRNGYVPEGHDESMMFFVLDVDEELLKTLDIKIWRGEGFSENSILDDDAYLINRALAEKLGWEDPIGKIITRNGKHKVIGVVEDFHFQPLHHPVYPLVITNKPFDGFDYIMISMDRGDHREHIKQIESVWKSILPSEAISFHFLDRTLDSVYEQEKRFGKLFVYFSVLAILIACLGLFGLASFLVEQRTKEIGIRKVFGSTESAIIRLLTWDFSKRVLLANILAWPVAWFAMDGWMENFAFRAGLSWWIFIISGLSALLFAILTVGYQAFKAANTNPAEVVKYE